MKKYLLLIMLLFLLVGCGTQKNDNNQNNQENPGDIINPVEPETPVDPEEPVDPEPEQPVNPEPEQPVDPEPEQPSEPVTHNVQIKDIYDYQKNIKLPANEVGVIETSYHVTFEATLLCVLDAITSKTGYGNRYKILVADSTGFIYIKVDFKFYDYLKKYRDNHGVYQFEGNVSVYNDQLEVTSTVSKPVWKEGKTQTIDYTKLSLERTNLDNVYDDIMNLKLNTKGIAFSDLVTVDLLCLERDFQNTNIYLTDGKKIIIMHGSDKLTNQFSKGKTYKITAALSMFNYRPGLEFVKAESTTNEITFDTSSLSSMKPSEFYKYTYEVDKNATYTNYSNLFKQPVVVEGYINFFYKSGKINVVIEDNYKENEYRIYQNAAAAKALFLKNSNCVALEDEYQMTKCELLNYLDNTKVKLVILPYMWNTNNYFEAIYYQVL